MKRASVNITVKALFAVFLVIFVLFIAISSFRTRTTLLTQRQHFDYYAMSDQFFLSFLSSPACLTFGDYRNSSTQVPIQGLLDLRKLNQWHGTNTDMGCAESYTFLYSVEVVDLQNGKSWNSGIRDKNYPWVERKIKTSLPVAIKYDLTKVNLGEASLTIHIGEIPYFYGTIKKACKADIKESVPLKNKVVVSYNNQTNQFCAGKDCFAAYFSCAVNSFRIPKGDNLVFVNHLDTGVEVLI